MANDIARLGKETLIYGTSTVVARLLNFCLVPFYTYYLATADYGVVATLFAVVALLNVVFLFGMDQSYLRFASEAQNKNEVFLHCFYGLFSYCTLLALLLYAFATPVAELVGVGPANAYLVRLCAAILFLDALNNIPFTKLRLQRRAWYFAGVRTASIAVNVLCNVLFVAVFKMGIASILWANVIASAASLLLLSPVVWQELHQCCVLRVNKDLRDQMLKFAWPFVPAGLASMLVSVVDKPILVNLIGLSEVGIYQANFKIGVFMMLIVSMFDQAWRPFFLSHAKDACAKELFAKVFSWFTALSAWVLLGLALIMPWLIQSNVFGSFHLISPSYWGGLHIIPLVLTGYFFYGLYVNFMVGPVLTKRTKPLLWITLLGAGVSVASNFALVPRIGIAGAGWAVLLSYFSMAVALFAFTQKVYPIRYEYGKLLGLATLAGLIALISWQAGIYAPAETTIAVRIALLVLYPLVAGWILLGKKLLHPSQWKRQ